MKKVAILGGGNGAHAAAVDLTLRGFEVRLYEDKAFVPNMQTVFDTREIRTTGVCGEQTVTIATVTSDLEEAIDGVGTILLIVPAFAHGAYAEKLAGLVRPGQIVFLLPGTFGSLILWDAFQKAGVRDVVVAETHTLPYATRLKGPGDVTIMGRFNPLMTGVMPACRTAETVSELSQYFDGLTAVESVVACGLSSLNPTIHVPGCILNAGRIEYAKGEFFFYTEGFTESVARATEAVDGERIELLKKFGYQWDIVAHSIGGAAGTDDLREAVAGNPSFTKIKGPADVKNRYYSEDIPYGIALWAKLAKLVGVETPIMDSMVHLGGIILQRDCWTAGHSMADLGIGDMDLEHIHRYLIQGSR